MRPRQPALQPIIINDTSLMCSPNTDKRAIGFDEHSEPHDPVAEVNRALQTNR